MNTTDSEINILLTRMQRTVANATQENKHTSQRYISLCNNRLQTLFKATNDWTIIGASSAIKEQWEKKFGTFVPMVAPATRHNRSE